MGTLNKIRYACSVYMLMAVATLVGCKPADHPVESTQRSQPPHVVLEHKDAEQVPLNIEVFNLGEHSTFAVSSVLVTGTKDAVLIDTQFSAADARQLVEKIKASGKRLMTIYISHGDPDYYFGLDIVHAAFPEAQLLATPQTIAHIQATKDAKLKLWGPQLGQNAPKQILIPKALEGDQLMLEGQALRIIGLDRPTPDHTFVWIPSIRTIAGGILVTDAQHVWMADTQTPQSHLDWLAMLDRIKSLDPKVVVPGHFLPGASLDGRSVTFTADYIRAFDEETAKAKDAAALIAAMQRRYPGLGGEKSLEISAKVAKGEMEWK
ncbi:MBL fold metallo-hydrolase [Xylella taiwanensis]|uniref:MBL fold metallo-hydrolase n=2 Tax=Xylella taiwanensis TaxID=1444770 RepID=A0ABS8TTW9_9GAMM|nr:MBL fold metallo-hydrolase [Xylella taiwanensis]AXI83794.1 beta-lactamase [Xylella taiwanensis]MCD8456897.1 MBL fold metallo-hydrolase [Xylella taiwanensis]MCD8459309.1 MBL fold metallo-hydrolase [Xylella taiwanensis]MCD8461820.1 MBL fold metallo-hydrolase [Xylella taiwanensis]MCD8462147.1 MBL fold metallo-hydrolase [Xylella taiwanensis]